MTDFTDIFLDELYKYDFFHNDKVFSFDPVSYYKNITLLKTIEITSASVYDDNSVMLIN